MYSSLCYFFFFKQKTAYELRISDWSSDVCSSDLTACRQCAPRRCDRGGAWLRAAGQHGRRSVASGDGPAPEGDAGTYFAMRGLLRPDQAARFDQAVVKALTAKER